MEHCKITVSLQGRPALLEVKRHNQDARVADSSGHSLLLVGIAQGPLDVALALYYIVDREMRMPEDVKFRPQSPDLTLQRNRAGDLKKHMP